MNDSVDKFMRVKLCADFSTIEDDDHVASRRCFRMNDHAIMLLYTSVFDE